MQPQDVDPDRSAGDSLSRSTRAPTGLWFGLRTRHYGEFLSHGSPVSLVEAISENFMGRGGRPLAVLERVRRDADVILHGVSLSIGGTDPISQEYLRQLRELRKRIQAIW